MSEEITWQSLFRPIELLLEKTSPEEQWYVEGITGKFGKTEKLLNRQSVIFCRLNADEFTDLEITFKTFAEIVAVGKDAKIIDNKFRVTGNWIYKYYGRRCDAEPSILEMTTRNSWEDNLGYNYPGKYSHISESENFEELLFRVPFCDAEIHLENESLSNDWQSLDELNFTKASKWHLHESNELPPLPKINSFAIYHRTTIEYVIPDDLEEITDYEMHEELIAEFKPS